MKGLRRVAIGLVVVLTTVGVIITVVAEQFGAASLAAAEARVDANELVVAMADQNRGFWNYAATHQAASMQVYHGGRSEADQALGELASRLRGTALESQVRLVDADARNWQRWAEGLLAAGPSRAISDPAVGADGNGRFQRFRTDAERLDNSLTTEVDNALLNAQRVGALASVILVGASVSVGVVLILLVRRVVRLGLDPVLALAGTVRRIAGGEQLGIPYCDGEDEVAELARALQAGLEAAAERAIMSEQAPVGICRTDAQGRLVSVNETMLKMLGRPSTRVLGQSITQFLHEEDFRVAAELMRGVTDGSGDRMTIELRCIRADGTLVWCSVVASPLRGPHGGLEGYVASFEDISERKRQMDRAARIQRELLPQVVPALVGFDLAGGCLPAQEVAGDFYDWVLTRRGELDLTVADVMGKGVGAALVATALRASLRTAPEELGPAERLQLAAASMALGADEDGLFVTVFHGRLEPRTGELRYVDAGHGYCAILRAGGELVALPHRSLPVGVVPGEEFDEGRATLEPGDTLLVHSDGLIELGDQPIQLASYVAEIVAAADAADGVRRLQARMPSLLRDDVTVLVLRRQAEPATLVVPVTAYAPPLPV